MFESSEPGSRRSPNQRNMFLEGPVVVPGGLLGRGRSEQAVWPQTLRIGQLLVVWLQIFFFCIKLE